MNATDPEPDERPERPDAGTAAGTQDVGPAQPDGPARSPAWWRRPAGRLALAAAAVVVAITGTAVGLAVAGDDGDPVRTGSRPPDPASSAEPGHDGGDSGSAGPETTDAAPTTAPPEEGRPVPTTPTPPPSEPTTPPAGDAAVVAVTYDGPGLAGGPDIDLRFADASGAEVARRNLSETAGSGGGLVQRVPAGAQELHVAHGGGAGPRCTQPYEADPNARLILRVEAPDRGSCARVETVAEWTAGRTGPTGGPYVGLTVADADARAAAAGLTTRVVGLNGADMMMTMDLRTDRLNLMVFDGVVVAARLDTE